MGSAVAGLCYFLLLPWFLSPSPLNDCQSSPITEEKVSGYMIS